MLFFAGLILLALGLVCGALLLLIPLGLVDGAVGTALWVLFPAFAIGGYLMAATTGPPRSLSLLTRGSGALLMALALAAAIVLVLQAASIYQPRGETLSLWYVLVLGVVLGASGLASQEVRKTT